jgi:hypothetical protein
VICKSLIRWFFTHKPNFIVEFGCYSIKRFVVLESTKANFSYCYFESEGYTFLIERYNFERYETLLTTHQSLEEAILWAS